MDSYGSIIPLNYLDFGITSNIEKTKKDFSDTRLCLIYSIVDLKNKTIEEIRYELHRIRDTLTPCEIIIGDIDAGTPDEMVMDFYRLAAEVWEVEIEELVSMNL